MMKITPGMIQAGVKAYLGQASHDEMSFRTPEELIEEILQAAIGELRLAAAATSPRT